MSQIQGRAIHILVVEGNCCIFLATKPFAGKVSGPCQVPATRGPPHPHRVQILSTAVGRIESQPRMLCYRCGPEPARGTLAWDHGGSISGTLWDDEKSVPVRANWQHLPGAIAAVCGEKPRRGGGLVSLHWGLATAGLPIQPRPTRSRKSPLPKPGCQLARQAGRRKRGT